MKKYIVLFIIIISTINTWAQVPGFLGSKNSVGGGMLLFPSSKDYGYTTQSYTPKWDSTSSWKNLGIKTGYNLFAERVLDRYISVNLNYNLQRGGYYSIEEFEYIDSQGNINFEQRAQGYNVVASRYEALFKFFIRNSGGLAPLGTYVGVGLNYSTIKGWTVGKKDSTVNTMSLPAMSITWGKTRIYGENIMLDFGIRCTPFYFNGLVNVLKQPVNSLKPASYMYGRNLLFAYINIGYLL